MRRLVLLVAVAAALAAPGTAPAKSWISISGVPEGISAGQAWDVTVTFPSHPDAGPLPRRPELVYTHLDTWRQRRFPARPTADPAVFRARVALPAAGRWTVYVYDRAIGAVSPGPGARELVVRPAKEPGHGASSVVAAAVAVFALAALFARRRR